MTSDIKEKIKMSKIEQLIGEIEEFIDGCKLQPFSSTKIVVIIYKSISNRFLIIAL